MAMHVVRLYIPTSKCASSSNGNESVTHCKLVVKCKLQLDVLLQVTNGNGGRTQQITLIGGATC